MCFRHVLKSLFSILVGLIYLNTVNSKNVYKGDLFPDKYLLRDVSLPDYTDLNHYIGSVLQVVSYFTKTANYTDVNTALGLFYLKSILKRTLQDDGKYFLKNQLSTVKQLIAKSDVILSHYIYMNKGYGWKDLEFRVSLLFKDDAPQVYSIGEFKSNKLTKWLKRESHVNSYSRDFDTLALPKEEYVALVEFKKVDGNQPQHIQLDDSDSCLSRVMLNPTPIEFNKLQPCRYDPFCFNRIYRAPSVAYTLSHRMINNLMLRQIRRCYIRSADDDALHIEMLCASMYRETVYIARRGYFARDLFLEHVAMCGLLGYEEFFRRHWFRKVASWIDEDGCIQENLNFERNRTRYLINEKNGKKDFSYKKALNKGKKVRLEFCHHHPMALLMIVLGHAIRHAIQYIGKNMSVNRMET